MDQLVFAFGITGPILLLLCLGWGIRRLSWVDDAFTVQANTIVFNIAMPVLLFSAISGVTFGEAIDLTLTLVGAVGTLLLIALLLLAGRLLPEDQRGVFIQGSYRGNLGVLGIALCVATYGDGILPVVALYISVVTTIYNVLAVWVLNSSGAFSKIVKNPILIGVICGALVSIFNIQLPVFITSTGAYLAQMALPLALLCIGASLDFSSLKSHGRSISLAVFFKLIVSPALLVGIGLTVGLDNQAVGVLFFMAASPTATASYIMARQMTAHGALAAEIIAVTTMLGVVSYTFGLALLRATGLV